VGKLRKEDESYGTSGAIIVHWYQEVVEAVVNLASSNYSDYQDSTITFLLPQLGDVNIDNSHKICIPIPHFEPNVENHPTFVVLLNVMRLASLTIAILKHSVEELISWEREREKKKQKLSLIDCLRLFTGLYIYD